MKTFARFTGCALLLLCALLPAHAQATPPATPAPAFSTQAFSFQANAIALPGGKQTTAGALTGATLQITQNFDLRQTDFVATGSNISAFFGGVDYTIAPFSKWLDNISPNLDGYNFQLQATASMGVDRVTPAGSTNIAEHYAFLAGGRLSYAIAGSNTWGLVADIEYAKLPGLANNTVIVSVGPTIHF